jgi:hypothetical protein
MQKLLVLLIASFIVTNLQAQPTRWQQKIKYDMDITMNVQTNTFTGKQKITYTNNSPDVLNRVFFHLYFNAFQPNSSMDARSRELGKINNGRGPDWDGRVRDRILNLQPNEIGYQKIKSVKINNVAQTLTLHETILEVTLAKPIAPQSTIVLDVDFEAQVPLQVRRSGRDNPQTGVRLSMAQWYPKIAEYDYEGWHPTPYVAREFYGIWGDFDVRINIDPTYKLGGTGLLKNAEEIGWGYDKANTPDLKPTKTPLRKWHFIANNVHDFVWAADPEYKHLIKTTANGIQLHVLYDYKPNNKKNDEDWATVLKAADAVLPFIETNFGKYPYPQYSFIQGGDGGMEYPMATLLVGPGLGTVFHEWMHSWYQMMLGTNESLYAWMDEGFTSYAENLVSKHYYGMSDKQDYKAQLAKVPNDKTLNEIIKVTPEDHSGAYWAYFNLQKSGKEEPLTTHADHYNTNYAYSTASYTKGEVFMEQLGYIIGAPMRDKVLLDYYNQWKFKHPNVNDFIQVAEKASGIKLDWYKEYWVNSTKAIDYGIDSLWADGNKINIRIKRVGYMPMPIDVSVTDKNGAATIYNIPLNLMYGKKATEAGTALQYAEPWRWTHPTYTLTFTGDFKQIASIEIDATKRMADINRVNNEVKLADFK